MKTKLITKINSIFFAICFILGIGLFTYEKYITLAYILSAIGGFFLGYYLRVLYEEEQGVDLE